MPFRRRAFNSTFWSTESKALFNLTKRTIFGVGVWHRSVTEAKILVTIGSKLMSQRLLQSLRILLFEVTTTRGSIRDNGIRSLRLKEVSAFIKTSPSILRRTGGRVRRGQALFPSPAFEYSTLLYFHFCWVVNRHSKIRSCQHWSKHISMWSAKLLFEVLSPTVELVLHAIERFSISVECRRIDHWWRVQN